MMMMNDEHNTGHNLLLLFADAFTAPALISHLSELDELMVALSCLFALTFSPLHSNTGPDLLAHDPGHDL